MEESMQLPKLRTVVESAVVGVALGCTIVLGLTVKEQQDTISALVMLEGQDSELEQRQEAMLWDLHRRVLALEGQDERIMAHIRWFVMRRSGTDELRRMEAAIVKLEAE
jgi:hypothetical protein